jgi:hypothetical protein
MAHSPCHPWLERGQVATPTPFIDMDGESVADIQGAIISQANGTVAFQTVRTAGKADPTREVEYQDWVLNCPNPPRPAPNVIVGQYVGMLVGETGRVIRELP